MPRCSPRRSPWPPRAGAGLAVTSELSLLGYPPRDLLLRRAFVARGWTVCEELARSLAGGPPLLVGLAETNEGAGKPLYNAAALLAGGTRAPGLPQDAAAHLRRLRRGPLLRAGRRSAGPRLGRRALRHLRLRGRLERPRLLEAAALPQRPDRRPRGGRRHVRRQPLGVAVQHRQAAPSRGDARRHRAQARRAGDLREPGGRQRRARLRRPQLRLRRRRRARRPRPRPSPPTCWSSTSTSCARAAAPPSRPSALAADDFTPSRDLARARPRRARLREQERLRARAARSVGRHRLGAGGRRRRRGARPRQRARRAHAVALLERAAA